MLDKSNIALLCIFVMFIGFLFPPVALSISMFIFGVSGIWGINPKKWFTYKWWIVGVAWVLVFAITYFWSDNKGTWYVHFQQKYPILILPIAFYFMPKLTARQLQIMTISIAVLLLASAFYSLSFLISDPDKYIRQYKYSVVLPTLPKRDHIRVSLAMVLFIVWSVYVWPFLSGKPAKWFIGITVAVLAIYLHVLSAKSGLIAFYLFLAGWGLYITFAKKKLAGIIVIITIPVCVFLAISFIPTFRERANYMDFTYFMFKRGDISGQYGDINRLLSYNVALSIIKEHPLAGVGIGDVFDQMTIGYHSMYPKVPEEAILMPHNQFLMVALGCGIPAMLLFLFWVFMPLAKLRANRRSFFFFMIWLILFLQLMIEPVLEVQLGVFVYIFFLLLLLKELEQPEDRQILHSNEYPL